MQSKTFKKIAVVFAIVFYFMAFYLAFNAEPFLKFGYLGVFVFNLFGPGTLLIPALSRYMNVILLSLVTALGMSFNDSVSWLAGRSGDVILPRSKSVIRFEKHIKRYGAYAIFLWALIPFPFDFVALIAGYLGLPFKKFFVPVTLGRLVRFVLMGFGVVSIWGKI